MMEFNTTTKQDNGYIPYPLRYKEKEEDGGKLLITTLVFGSGYLLFLTIIGMKLGFL